MRLNTVLGSIDSHSVGRVLAHEHLIIDMTHEAIEPLTPEAEAVFYGNVSMGVLGELSKNPYIVRDNLILDSVDDAVDEIESVKKYGCNLVVDLTSIGLGRDVNAIRNISKRADIPIIAGCGLFVDTSLSTDQRELSTAQIERMIFTELESGVGETGIKPGVIGEIGTSEVLYPIEKRMLEAAGTVGSQTGLPIYIHTYPWSRAGLEAIDMLLARGVNPGKICICHLDVAFDPEYIKEALAREVYVEFDNIGKEFFFEPQGGAFAGGPFEMDIDRARMIERLIEAGHLRRLLMSNDLCLKASLRKYGGKGYAHIFAGFCPMLKCVGVDERSIETLMSYNAKEFLFGEA